ncbi:MAG: hypothetical protein RRY34_04770, partial [Victivallaceae bacterium]
KPVVGVGVGFGLELPEKEALPPPQMDWQLDNAAELMLNCVVVWSNGENGINENGEHTNGNGQKTLDDNALAKWIDFDWEKLKSATKKIENE